MTPVNAQEKYSRSNGFTLLEILVAFALLALLLSVIIQSQAETAYFLEKTAKLSLVQQEVINELLKIERNYSDESIETSEGTFPDEHVLAGDTWIKEAVQEDFFGLVPVMKIKYRVTWKTANNEQEQYFESSIIGEIR